MNPLKIRAEGYGRFDSFDIDLPEGTVGIVGPNGAGKSRLLSAVELALFAGRGELAQWLAPGHDRLLLELVFEHSGQTYRVRRIYQGGTRSRQTVDFEHHVFSGANAPSDAPGGWDTLTRETAAATDDLIVETLGLSRATFGASAFLGQGNAGQFTEAKAADRKELLGEILDPHGLWPRLANRAKADAKEAETTLWALAPQILEREEALKTKSAREDDVELFQDEERKARANLAAAEETLEQAQHAIVANAAAAERIQTLTATADRARADRDRVSGELVKAKTAAANVTIAEANLTIAEQKAARVAELEEKLDEQKTLRAAAQGAEQRRRQEFEHAAQLAGAVARIAQDGELLAKQHDELSGRHAHLNAAGAGTERCDRCEQILGAEARAAALASMRAELEGLDAAITAKAVAMMEARELAERALAAAEAIEVPQVPDGAFEDNLRAARAAAEQVTALRWEIERLEAVADTSAELERQLLDRNADLAAREEELGAALQTAPDRAALDSTLADAKRAVEACRTTLEAAAHDLTRARQSLEQLAETRSELEALTREQARQQDRLDLLKLAEKAFGRDGIPALIAENAIPQIEAKANQILELMPTAKGETLRVELRTQRELKTAEHLKETLDIVALDAHGGRPYETYSGGEKGRLNVALRLALAQLLAHRRGAESRVLCLDEVEYLDQLGQEQLVDVVRSVGDAYDRVLVVSHAAGVRDAFETVIEIASDGDGRSYLVGQEARVEVLA